MKEVCGGLRWSCLMLILTSHLQLALSTKFIIQMLMKCESTDFDVGTYYIGSYYEQAVDIDVYELQVGLGLFGCYQPDMEPYVW